MRKMAGAIAFLFCATLLVAQQTRQEREHYAWISRAILAAQTIRPGMQRNAFDADFTTEGGISTATWRTYVWRECPYIKIQVEFKPVSQQQAGAIKEDATDVITGVSQPYLQFPVVD